MATLCIDQLPTGNKAWIEDVVFVKQAYRGRGYARQLIRHLIQQAQDWEMKSINLTLPSRNALQLICSIKVKALNHEIPMSIVGKVNS